MTRHLVATAAVTAVLGAAGCQGGSGSGELSKSQFVERANAVCTKANERIAALPDPNLADPDAAPGAIRRIVEIQRDAVAQLRDLEPPETDVPAIQEWLGFVDDALDEAEQAVRALERDDRDALNEANAKGRDAQRQADEQARTYGATRCAVEPEEPTTTT